MQRLTGKKGKKSGKIDRKKPVCRVCGLYTERWLFNLPVITPWLPLHTNRAACLRSGRRPSSPFSLARQLAFSFAYFAPLTA